MKAELVALDPETKSDERKLQLVIEIENDAQLAILVSRFNCCWAEMSDGASEPYKALLPQNMCTEEMDQYDETETFDAWYLLNKEYYQRMEEKQDASVL